MLSIELTSIFLLCGAVALLLAFRTLMANSNIPSYQRVEIPRTQQSQASPEAPLLTSEKERAQLEAPLEAAHREEWCKKFEDEELRRKFREKFCQHVFNRQYQEDALRLQMAQEKLEDLRLQRRALEYSILRDGLYGCGIRLI